MQLDITKPFLCLGRLGANYLLVQATYRAYRVVTTDAAGKTTEDNSGDWLHTKIDVTAGNFRGSLTTHARLRDFARFRDDLRRLDASLASDERTNRRATFDSPGAALRITIGAEAARVYTATCEVSDASCAGALLLFTIPFDRSEMPDIIRSLDRMLAEFPPPAATA